MWKLGTGDLINLGRSSRLHISLKDEKDMGMRKTTLLKLDDVKGANWSTKYSDFVEFIKDETKFNMKDASHHVRAVWGFLARKEAVDTLWPLWVTGDCDKEVRLTSAQTIAMASWCFSEKLMGE